MTNITEPIRVFVYGSLLPGLQNAHYLRSSTNLGSGKTVGVLFSMGAFPALVTNRNLKTHTTDTVKGAVFEIDHRTLAQLDRLEGYVENSGRNLYERELVDITLDSGEVVKAFVYSASEYIIQDIIQSHLEHVPSGDWMAWARRYILPHLNKRLEF